MPMTDYVDEMNRYYRARAPWHDDYLSLDNAAIQALLIPIKDSVKETLAGRDVLEIACGTGNWTRFVAACARRVTATDISPEMIDLARKKLHSCKNVSYHVHDAYAIDAIEETFSAAIAVDWWSHVPVQRLHDFLSRLHTRLEPGSSVIFIDMLHRPELDGDELRADVHGNRVSRRRLPNGQSYWVIKNYPDAADMLGYLREFGTEIDYIEYAEAQRWLARCRSV